VTPPPGEFRVASYNIRKAIGTDRLRRPERILAVLAELSADIVILQEADRRIGARQSALPPDLIAAAGWAVAPFDIRPGGIGWHGNAILVRREVEILSCRAWPLPVLEPRGAVTAVVRVRDTTLRMVGMHLDLSGLWRRRQARAVIAHVEACDEALPTVLTGDLNEWSLAGGCLGDFATAFHFAPTGPSFHARRPVARLDRIMTTPDLAVADAGVHRSTLARRASDHLPIWADVRLR
jgi:endonuclease/exonuclease/phosphatase family metal-dependent hydrolase